MRRDREAGEEVVLHLVALEELRAAAMVSINTIKPTSKVLTHTNKEKEVSTGVNPSSLMTTGRRLRKTTANTTTSTKMLELSGTIRAQLVLEKAISSNGKTLTSMVRSPRTSTPWALDDLMVPPTKTFTKRVSKVWPKRTHCQLSDSATSLSG